MSYPVPATIIDRAPPAIITAAVIGAPISSGIIVAVRRVAVVITAVGGAIPISVVRISGSSEPNRGGTPTGTIAVPVVAAAIGVASPVCPATIATAVGGAITADGAAVSSEAAATVSTAAARVFGRRVFCESVFSRRQ
jgi:hypothetical protein